IHRDMKDLFLAKTDDEIQAIIQNMTIYEVDAQKQFEVMYERFLGPRKDIDEIRITFMQWKTIREETINLLRSGDREKAVQRTRDSFSEGGHAKNVLAQVNNISDFATKKATEFYQDATKLHTTLNTQVFAIVGLLVFLTAGSGYFLFTRIRGPLNELTIAAQEFQTGNFAARSSYVSKNEFGTLSKTFNQMADAISLRIATENNNAAIAKALIAANELKAFAETVLEKYMEVTESNLGAFYIRNRENNQFSPLAAIGVNRELLEPFDAAIYEGEFGRSLKTGQTSHIKNIDQETVFKFKTFAGTCVPREIITIPVVVNGKVLAMLSLASISSYSEAALSILSQPALIALNTAFANLMANDETRLLAEKLRENNHELIAQQEELQAQTEELQAQAEELHNQNIELERQRLAVEEANRLKSAFLSNMSHELRTPLNSVMALSRVLMMQAENKLSPEEISYLEIIGRNGKNLLNLINEILDLAKIEAGRMDVNPQAFPPGQTIEGVVDSLTPLAKEKNISIIAEIPENLPALESDELRVHQILQNLLANAVKFTAVGKVTVRATAEKEKLLIQVEDTGIGISKEDLPHIFDEFRQVDDSSSRKHEGTGLGLAIARKTARMLNGEIAVTSTYGAGSIFTLTLPLFWKGAAKIQDVAEPRIHSSIKAARKTILVVDDEPEMAAMVSRYLLQEGYN
ncbi:MAG: multi-sensor hybrid histidine kinase, partial [uncultured bacterium]